MSVTAFQSYQYSSVDKGRLFLLFKFSIYLAAGLTVMLAFLTLTLPQALAAVEGREVFQQKCTSCHTVGGGKTVGPDLQGVTARRDRDWLLRYMKEPAKVRSENDPVALQLSREYQGLLMPDMGLSDSEIHVLLAYLDEDRGGGKTLTEPGDSSVTGMKDNMSVGAGEVTTGKSLFTGAVRFQSGGSPCMACHDIAGLAGLGGGVLGPDLTPAYIKYGADGLKSVLAASPFPTMKPIYGDRPLTPEEQVHLSAFLQAAATSSPSEHYGQFGLLAVGGFLLLIFMAQATWRRRLQPVRSGLVRQALTEGSQVR